MAFAQGTVPASAAKADGETKGTAGGQSRNTSEIVRYIRSEDQMMRIAALGQLAGNVRALAYLAATAEYSDVREAAMAQMLKNKDGLFKLLEGMTGRCPEPWERELVQTLKKILDNSKGDKLLGLKVWQLQDSAPFRPSGSCPGADGKKIEFIDESPATANFSSGVLAGMIDAPQD